MKKILLIVLVLISIINLSSCTENKEDVADLSEEFVSYTDKNLLTVNDFYEKVCGYWGYMYEGRLEVVHFYENEFEHFVYCGAFLLKGEVVGICENNGNIMLTVSHRRNYLDLNDDETDTVQSSRYFTSNDNFSRNLILLNDLTGTKRFPLTYLGETMSEVETAAKDFDLLKEKSTTNVYVPEDARVADITLDILNISYYDYSKMIGTDAFLKFTNPGNTMQYYTKYIEEKDYYYVNETFIAGENGEIELFACYGSLLSDKNTPSVSEIINELKLTALFSIEPAFAEVNNGRNVMSLYYWKTNNGYIGFITVNGYIDPSSCYSCGVLEIIAFEDLSYLNII